MDPSGPESLSESGRRPRRPGRRSRLSDAIWLCWPACARRPSEARPAAGPRAPLKVAPKEGEGLEVKLWDKPIDNPGLTLALLYWHSWRARLDRPEQSRLHRKAWAYSDLLFPNSTGEVLGKQALHDALRRLGDQPGGGARLTPERIRQAFLQLGA
jgi:hypothetical protein